MIKRRYLIGLGFVIGWLFIPVGFALQMKSVTENGAITANISANELTRIAVDHDRILHVRGLEGAYDLKQDTVQGALFIRPTVDYQSKPFSVFIATEAQHNYVLHLTPQNTPADTILLKPKGIHRSVVDSGHVEKGLPYTKTLADLMTTMITHTPSPEYSVEIFKKAKRHRVNKNITIQLVSVYEGKELQGYIYRMINRSAQALTLSENTFYQPGDCAIALSHPSVLPGGEVLLYKVKRRD
jgi:conjugal transfer pilus assembly protein TraK